MKQKLVISLIFFASGLYAQYNGPIPAIHTGYGSDSLDVSVLNIPNEHFPIRDISVFYPTENTTSNPTIFYSHGYGGNDTTQQTHILRHIASKGYTVVFVPYASILVTIEDRYNTLLDGFIKAAQDLPHLVDTTRIGFYGHSFGGGATPSIAYRLFTQRDWGSNGKFMYCSAPWYTYALTPSELANFPTDCNLLTVLYENDEINDHRMGIDIFEHISINNDNKDCLIVHSDTVSNYHYQASHSLPSQMSNSFDAYDCYVTFRLMDAIADFTFNGNLRGKNVALSNGSAEQVDMGGVLTPLTVSDHPQPSHPKSFYLFPCDTIENPRQQYCDQVSSVNSFEESSIKIYPNPAKEILFIESTDPVESITMLNAMGQIVAQRSKTNSLDIASLDAGIYFILVESNNKTQISKIIK